MVEGRDPTCEHTTLPLGVRVGGMSPGRTRTRGIASAVPRVVVRLVTNCIWEISGKANETLVSRERSDPEQQVDSVYP